MALEGTVVQAVVTIFGTGGLVALILNWRAAKLSEERLREIEDSKQFTQLIDVAYGWGSIHFLDAVSASGSKESRSYVIGPVSMAGQLAALHSLASIAVRNPQFRLGALRALKQISIGLNDGVVSVEAEMIEHALRNFFGSHRRVRGIARWVNFFEQSEA